MRTPILAAILLSASIHAGATELLQMPDGSTCSIEGSYIVGCSEGPTTATATPPAPTLSESNDGSDPTHCMQLESRIKLINKQRRHGASAGEMDRLNQLWRQYENLYRKHCT